MRPEAPFKLPALDQTPIPNPHPQTLFEVTFLAYISQHWYPCMTDQNIRDNLASPYNQWEKTMYHAISAWKAKDPDADKDTACELDMRDRACGKKRADGDMCICGSETDDEGVVARLERDYHL